jgi:hypothetical protein
LANEKPSLPGVGNQRVRDRELDPLARDSVASNARHVELALVEVLVAGGDAASDVLRDPQCGGA